MRPRLALAPTLVCAERAVDVARGAAVAGNTRGLPGLVLVKGPENIAAEAFARPIPILEVPCIRIPNSPAHLGANSSSSVDQAAELQGARCSVLMPGRHAVHDSATRPFEKKPASQDKHFSIVSSRRWPLSHRTPKIGQVSNKIKRFRHKTSEMCNTFDNQQERGP